MDPLVIKLGGSVMEQLHPSFFAHCAELLKKGVQPVLVHGGGPAINRMQRLLGREPEFVKGLRVTNEDDMELVEMVLAGSVNKRLVTRLEAAGGPAVGISGADRGLIRVRPKDPALGCVGEVTGVETALLEALMDRGWIPVVASIGVYRGRHYNINADTAAAAIAGALGAPKWVIVTDVPGIYGGRGEKKHRLEQVTPRRIDSMIANGEIRDGMVPKVMGAVAGLRSSVREVWIVDGRRPGCLSLDGNRSPHGTRIVKEEAADHGLVSNVST